MVVLLLLRKMTGAFCDRISFLVIIFSFILGPSTQLDIGENLTDLEILPAGRQPFNNLQNPVQRVSYPKVIYARSWDPIEAFYDF